MNRTVLKNKAIKLGKFLLEGFFVSLLTGITLFLAVKIYYFLPGPLYILSAFEGSIVFVMCVAFLIWVLRYSQKEITLHNLYWFSVSVMLPVPLFFMIIFVPAGMVKFFGGEFLYGLFAMFFPLIIGVFLLLPCLLFIPIHKRILSYFRYFLDEM